MCLSTYETEFQTFINFLLELQFYVSVKILLKIDDHLAKILK